MAHGPSEHPRRKELEALMRDGRVDNLMVAFADMQGRLTGKRVAARLFVEEVAAHGAECCNYLLAVDVEMNTLDGFALTSWEAGYGDFVLLRPRFSAKTLLLWGTPILVLLLGGGLIAAACSPAPAPPAAEVPAPAPAAARTHSQSARACPIPHAESASASAPA